MPTSQAMLMNKHVLQHDSTLRGRIHKVVREAT